MRNGEIILVTGASSGMGRETAITLAKEGYVVYAAARRLDKLSELESNGCIPLELDIANDESIVNAVKIIETNHGGVDVLFNNAGIAILGSVEEMTIEDARKTFDVNVFGLVRLTQLVIPYMRKKGAGKIINNSSIAGKTHGPITAWYAASKHAVEGFNSCLRVELQPFGIQVVAIRPGAISTGLIGSYVDELMETSGKGAYGKMTKSVADWSKSRDGNPKYSSHPSVIADCVLKIVRSKKPKTAYMVGKTAKQMIWSRRLLSDRTLDNMMLKFIKS